MAPSTPLKPKPAAKSTRTPAPKAATKPAAKPAAAAAKPATIRAPNAPMAETPGIGTEALRKKEFVERVVAAFGGKRKGVKEIVDATLATLGAALDKGEALNLPPFGKARIAKQKGDGPGAAITLKVRRSNPSKNLSDGAKDDLADSGEDS